MFFNNTVNTHKQPTIIKTQVKEWLLKVITLAGIVGVFDLCFKPIIKYRKNVF